MNCCRSWNVIFCGVNCVSNSLLDLVQAAPAVEHAQDRVLFFVKAEVVQPHRLLDDPERPAVVAMPPRCKSGRIRSVSGRDVLIRLSASVAMERRISNRG